VADFRDPWTDINYYQELPHTALAERVDAGLERMVLRRAQAVTTVSPTWRDLLLAKSGRDKEAFAVVQNGFDADDLPDSPPAPVWDRFELVYVGSLYASRNPEALWKALSRLRSRDQIPELRIRLVGTVDPNVNASLEAHGLNDITNRVSYLPHSEAIERMHRASLLLLLIEDFAAAEGMITAKIYEYMATGRPILGVGPEGGDAQALLQSTKAGRLFARSDVSGIARFVANQYAAWADGNLQSGATEEVLRSYRRRAQTKQMAGVLERCVR
jgi:glycosyltransferase involved in cell wall biosynthesis